jgi:hypothetical protein
MTTPFWTNDPSVLFNKDSITQLWPNQKMTNEAKMNAVSRLVILMTILGFILTRNIKIIFIGSITLAILFTVYKFRKQVLVNSLIQNVGTTEGFSNSIPIDSKLATNSKTTYNPVTLETVLRSNFHPTTKKNPFGNVLLTDIGDSPNRLAAAPSFNPDVYDEIDSAVKKQSQMLNPGIKNTNKQLYGDLKGNYDLDNSMMRFYSTANTRVENDQSSFSQYLYGDMYSGKESTPEGAMMRVKDNYRYILI